MSSIEDAYRRSLIMVAASNVLDLLSTMYAMRVGLKEANPIAKVLMEKVGTDAGAIITKTGELVSMTLLLYLVKEYLPRLGATDKQTSYIILVSGAINAIINTIITINNISCIIKKQQM